MGEPRYAGLLSPRTTSQCLVGWPSTMVWAYKMMVVLLETEKETEGKEMFLLNA